MQNPTPVNKPAMLRNVAIFMTLIEKVVDRRPDLPGLACFYGPSGYGKTKSAVYGANRYRAAYVECDQFTTAKSLLELILQELGVARPRGTVPNLIEQAVQQLAADPRRPLIIDEAHHIAHKRFIDLARTLHDKSTAPVILIGEETLPKQLEAHERVHNRMLDWAGAQPCDRADFNALAKASFPNLKISDELAERILSETKGNTRRIVVNLAKAEEVASQAGAETVDVAAFGRPIGSTAPTPRRAA
ncbi:MAG: ATP-binding protein [Microbacterium sp.]|nr:MAG: ATP-binding protein [Microbacterium sp.]